MLSSNEKMLNGKTAVVTGGSRGIGEAIVYKLASMGANTAVIFAGNAAAAESVCAKCRQEYGVEARAYQCNVADFSAVKETVAKIRADFGTAQILVNNAGFISLDRQETKEGVERQFGINHLGHFLLTTELLDHMPAGARIVNVASGAHKVGKIHFDDINLKHGYNVVRAYSQSKLANVLFTRELAMRLRDRKITVNCCHPKFAWENA